jgi:trehalose-6-phosphatase
MEGWAMENWTPIALAHNLEVRRFNGGVELRCPGMDKGSALQIILSRQPDDASPFTSGR